MYNLTLSRLLFPDKLPIITPARDTKYRVDVMYKDNLKLTTERLVTQMYSKETSFNEKKKTTASTLSGISALNTHHLGRSGGSGSGSGSNIIAATPGNISGDLVLQELRRHSIAAVMYTEKTLPQLRSFVTELQTRSTDVTLSAQQIVECSSLVSHWAVSPSMGIKGSATGPLSHDESTTSGVVSVLCNFLSDHLHQHYLHKRAGNTWSFEHTANVLFNLQHVKDGISRKGNSKSKIGKDNGRGVQAFRQFVLKIERSRPEPRQSVEEPLSRGPPGSPESAVSLQQIARAAAGLQSSSTSDGFWLLAGKLQQYNKEQLSLPLGHRNITTSNNSAHISAQVRDILSLFHVLKHHSIGVHAKNKTELKAYLKALTSIVSSDGFRSLPLTLEHYYGDIIAHLGGFCGKSKEEVVLLQAVEAVLTATAVPVSEPVQAPLLVPSLRSSCRAVAGLQGMSNTVPAVKSILKHVSESIAASHTSLSADMLVSVLNGEHM